MSAYPKEFPMAEIQSIVKMVREGSVKDNVSAFAKDVWIVQGYGQKMILGEGENSVNPPNNPPSDPSDGPGWLSSFSATPSVSEERALEIMDAMVDPNRLSVQSADTWDDLIKFLLSLLLEYLLKK